MSLTFTHPPHPAEVFLKQSTSSSKSPANAFSSARDPHNIPTFDSKSLTDPAVPVLYLPPLLSSLPEKYSSPPIPQRSPPLITETRLPDIDPASLSLHKALHHFKPVNADYASALYAEAFNWSDLVLPEHEEREWYCVVFRSKRKAGSDGGCTPFTHCNISYNNIYSPPTALYDADKKAHEEAVRNGGVLFISRRTISCH